MSEQLQIATLGGGCFWCVEAVLQPLKGVVKVIPGYAGGTVPGIPTYREVCSGLTGHAEVVEVHFNPEVISFETLLQVFMTTHDPTQLNKQGGDVGTQYRSVVYYHDSAQKAITEQVIKKLQPEYENPIVTEISPAPRFFPAESYHHNYYAQNADQGYCQYVITPKVAKLRQYYAALLK